MADRKDYEGKEQMWVKHSLLGNYLERLIMKIGTARKWKRFVYVDGYAGPWKTTTEDLSDSSFARALAVMRACQTTLAANGTPLPMRAVFCEKAKGSARRLIAFAEQETSSALPINARHADFTTQISSIASELADDDFAFALIDPTGFSEIAPATLAPLLRKRGVEVLINLMWEHASRFWNHEQLVDKLDAVFGADRGQRGSAEMYAAGLRAAAGSEGKRLWASAFPVLRVDKERTHYYLVYGTHSSVGLLTFDKAAEETWKEQALTRAQARVRKSCENSDDLFAGEVLDVQVVRPTDPPRYRTAWLHRLPVAGSEIVVTNDVLAGLLEQCGCLEKDLQLELKLLIEDGVVENRSIPSSRIKLRTKYVVKAGEVLRRLR